MLRSLGERSISLLLKLLFVNVVEIGGDLRNSAGFAPDGRVELVEADSPTAAALMMMMLLMMMMVMMRGTTSLLRIEVFGQLHPTTTAAATATPAPFATGTAATATASRRGGGTGGVGYSA